MNKKQQQNTQGRMEVPWKLTSNMKTHKINKVELPSMKGNILVNTDKELMSP